MLKCGVSSEILSMIKVVGLAAVFKFWGSEVSFSSNFYNDILNDYSLIREYAYNLICINVNIWIIQAFPSFDMGKSVNFQQNII